MPDTGEHQPPTGPGGGEPVPPTEGNEWRLTYAQLAARLGISGDAARIVVRRRGWQRILPNHPRGVTVVIVPAEALQDEDWRRVGGTDPNEQATPGDTGAEHAEHRATEAERRADEANTRADAALALADRTLAQLADAHARAERAEQGRDGERQRADVLRDRIDAMQTPIAAAEAAAEQERAGLRRRGTRPGRCGGPTMRGRRGGLWRGSGRRGGGSSRCTF